MPRITNPALLRALLLLSCASPPPGAEGPAAAASTEPSIEGVVWRWTGLAGPDALEVDRPGLYTISLDAQGGYAIRADCNRGSGTYAIQGGALELSPGPMTLAACPPGSQADRFLAFLGRVSGQARDGDRLTLSLADGGTMEFEAPKPVELAGTSWLVRAASNRKQGMASVQQGTRLSTAFGGDGSLSGSAGCNSYSGSRA
jgi:heat shock protein HslJ